MAITKRSDNYSEWYQDIIDAAELAEHGPVRGTMIIKPYGYAIWENIQRILDAKFKEHGVKNAYFPLFIPESFLKREKDHVEGFSPELAIVTHAGGKELEEPLVVRPTSETIIYDAFSRWIKSYRDLPLKINQWANVVRWEMRSRLFLRTTEFLWQEGHTAHATKEEADASTRAMLDTYQSLAEDYLAMPVIPGRKSESEKFAGADATYCIEAMMQDGKALQAGTSHLLDQNFSKAFEIKFLDQDNQEQYVWTSSWGVSTRIIGGLIMIHSDDNGLVLPPRIAPIQVVLTPIWGKAEEKDSVITAARKLAEELKNRKLLVEIDERDERPGAKYFTWEKKGVPVRIEIGPRDLASDSAVLVRRDTGEKVQVPLSEVVAKAEALLEEIQQNLLAVAKERRASMTVSVDTWDQFKKEIELGRFVVAHWDGTKETEAKIKEETKATIRCIPFDQILEEGVCVYSGASSHGRVIFAKSY